MSSIPPDPANPCPTCGSLTNTTWSNHSRSSRVSEMLRCSDAPSDSELPDFQNVVKSGPGHIADLDEKIARAKKHLTALIHERNVLETNIGDAKTLSSPIRRLPSDVLRDIALATIPSRYQVMELGSSRSDSSDSREAPWTLAQVSHRWRLIIVNAPEVWSSLSLVIARDETPTTVAHQMFMTGLRLERSKSLPLTLSVSVYSKADISNHPLILLISTRSSLIRNLRIKAPFISYQAFSWWRGRLDQLYRLKLGTTDSLSWVPESSRTIKSVIDAFEYGPRLKMITVENFYSSLFRFPQTQITHLTLIVTNGWKDVENIRQFHNLIDLRIMYPRSTPPVPSDHRIISLPALTSLTLWYLYDKPNPLPPSHHGSDPIFSFISIPNLTHLRLLYYTGFIVCPSIPMPNVITGLRLELDILSNTDPFPEKGLSALLESVPNLRDLVISPSLHRFSFDASLLVSILARIPLPHLRTLDFRGSKLRPENMHKFVEMIEARRQGNNGEMDEVETVYLRSPLTLDRIYAQRWKSLIEGGLQIVYGPPNDPW